MLSKARNSKIVRSNRPTRRYGRSSGTVICQNTCQRLAPSSEAPGQGQQHVRRALPDPDDPDRGQRSVGPAEPDDMLTDPMVDYTMARIEQQLPAQRANDGRDHHWYDERGAADADPRPGDVPQQRDTKAEYHFRGHSGRRVDEGDRDAASEDRIAQQVLIDSTREDRRQEEFNNSGAQVRRR